MGQRSDVWARLLSDDRRRAATAGTGHPRFGTHAPLTDHDWSLVARPSDLARALLFTSAVCDTTRLEQGPHWQGDPAQYM